MPVLKDLNKRKELRKELYDQLDLGLEIPEVIKNLRAILSMDQSQFSAYCEVSLSALRKIEQNQDNYNFKTLQKIMDKFDLKMVVTRKNRKLDI